jgi:hypothetical protein
MSKPASRFLGHHTQTLQSMRELHVVRSTFPLSMPCSPSTHIPSAQPLTILHQCLRLIILLRPRFTPALWNTLRVILVVLIRLLSTHRLRRYLKSLQHTPVLKITRLSITRKDKVMRMAMDFQRLITKTPTNHTTLPIKSTLKIIHPRIARSTIDPQMAYFSLINTLSRIRPHLKVVLLELSADRSRLHPNV